MFLWNFLCLYANKSIETLNFKSILQEENSRMSKSIEKLTQENQILSKRLRENGIDDSIQSMEIVNNSPMIHHKRATSYQGIMKYRAEDAAKLLQRLVDDLEPRVAKTLVPALPAYIVFMCIRWVKGHPAPLVSYRVPIWFEKFAGTRTL